MNKIYLTILFVFIISLTLVAAENQQTGLSDVKLGDCITLPQSDNASSCIISSIIYPNKTLAIVNLAMTKNGTSFYYNNYCVSQLGQYVINTECDGKPYPYNFQVTPNGITNVSIGNNSFLLILMGLAVILLIMAFTLKNAPLATMSGFAFMVSGVYTMINGFSNYADTYTRAGALFIIALGGILSVISGIEWLQDLDNSGSDIDEEEE